ncbi:MAG: hypothetical protein UT55_C0048G0007 [Candidatus Peregrinibacteria bacterium GW2011_GWE2_39_6]|nr:MAG: hypothetical protein UT36_C0004G0097 [Candidatus Peregrinibacteria bacterium GW2011_GWF2_39_17]KKR25176.1 MAG: hypothetical protein UT55_C0048G0007 [Candidatus Peregrinibacteria bacterium GW2011_GWE2_39_6]HCW32214.1 hypothetical protein [Candidatus Peregrinibacteria bacterium]
MKYFVALSFVGGGIGFLVGAFAFFSATQMPYNTAQDNYIFWLSTGIFVVIALVFFGAGLKYLFTAGRSSVSSAKGQKLKINGMQIMAPISGIKHQTNIRINGRAPYVIFAKALNPLTGLEQVFESAYIWEDLGINQVSSPAISIYIDPDNSKRYYMDLASIGIQVKGQSWIGILVVIIIFCSLVGSGVMVKFIFNDSGTLNNTLLNRASQKF